MAAHLQSICILRSICKIIISNVHAQNAFFAHVHMFTCWLDNLIYYFKGDSAERKKNIHTKTCCQTKLFKFSEFFPNIKKSFATWESKKAAPMIPNIHNICTHTIVVQPKKNHILMFTCRIVSHCNVILPSVLHHFFSFIFSSKFARVFLDNWIHTKYNRRDAYIRYKMIYNICAIADDKISN